MMWDTCRDKVVAQGSDVVTRTEVVGIRHTGGRATGVIAEDSDGTRTEWPCSEVISSMPISHLLQAMDPPASRDALAAAGDLRYRDFLTVALVVPADRVAWNDNWIYIHDPGVRTMRIQNFGSWSPYLVKDGRGVLGLEYTLFEGDQTWHAPDDELIEQAKYELERLGLIDAADVERGFVIRQPRAYPIYDERYRANVEKIRSWLSEHADNVHPVGRNGMFRYNNQDHSMYTAMLTVENIATGAQHDIWEVNVEEEYHEHRPAGTPERPRGTGRDAPLILRAAVERGRTQAITHDWSQAAR
jgi:protoporphyrinogen oxidase